MLFMFLTASAQLTPATSAAPADPASKVLLTTDTMTMRSTRNLEKGNSETVKTKDHPKVTRKTKMVKKDSASAKKKRN